MVHSIARTGQEATAGQTPVLVYNSKEYDDLSEISNRAGGDENSWDSLLGSSASSSKVYSLLPFQIESAFTPKKFVLRLELFPEAKYLRFHTLSLYGVQQVYLPISNVVPITKYDYWGASWLCFMKQHHCLDLDMIYANHVTKEMFVFDKLGEWKDEGVYHEALNMDNTFNETNWYDEFNVNSF